MEAHLFPKKKMKEVHIIPELFVTLLWFFCFWDYVLKLNLN